jgi:hypothetical protein
MAAAFKMASFDSVPVLQNWTEVLILPFTAPTDGFVLAAAMGYCSMGTWGSSGYGFLGLASSMSENPPNTAMTRLTTSSSTTAIHGEFGFSVQRLFPVVGGPNTVVLKGHGNSLTCTGTLSVQFSPGLLQ